MINNGDGMLLDWPPEMGDEEDCVKLIKQSIKCCHVIFEIRGARDNDFKGKLHEVC